jgi:hypothetical protein
MKLSFALLTVGLSLLISDLAQSAATPGQHIPDVIRLEVKASYLPLSSASYIVNLDTHRLTLTEGENSKTRGVKLSEEQVAEIQKLTAKVDATATQYPEQPDATAGPYWYVTITDYILGYWQPERDTESRGLTSVVEFKQYLDRLLAESSEE